MRFRSGLIACGAAVAALVIAACGSSSSNTSTSSSSSSGSKTVDIYSSLPLQGAVNVDTIPMVNGMKDEMGQLAIARRHRDASSFSIESRMGRLIQLVEPYGTITARQMASVLRVLGRHDWASR